MSYIMPDDIPVASAPVRNTSVALAIIDEHVFTRALLVQQLDNVFEITSFTSADKYLASTQQHDLVLYYIHGRSNPASELVQTRPVIVLADDDSYDIVFAAFKSGVRGYIPTASTSPELVIEIIHLVRRGGTFMPPSSLMGWSDNPPHSNGNGKFTPREARILEQLKLGKPNKFIALELEVSQSTVKYHIQNIMKKMGATNRTAAVSRALAL